MPQSKRKPLGQVAYEAEKKHRGETSWPEWDELDPAYRRIYSKVAAAVQSRDRARRNRNRS